MTCYVRGINMEIETDSAVTALFIGAAMFMSGCATHPDGVEFSRRTFFEYALERNEEQWNSVARSDPQPGCGIRWIYNYALLVAESGEELSRVDRLCQLGEQMQDKDAASPTFGNFRWYWRTGKVTDLNAVEFVSHHMIPLWIQHRKKLDPSTRRALERTLRRAVDACMRHEVHPSYTNIAISNAVNLILLGEQCGRADALAEGITRLETVCLTTWRYGICEYDSPTYYGVDLDMLVLLNKYVRSARVREVGQAMLEMFWTDIAVNWFAPGKHLAGTHSRSYNFPCGASDFLDRHLAQVGWADGRYQDWTEQRYLDSPERRFLDGAAWLDAIPGPWTPPARLRDIMEKQYPRDIFQRFGSRPAHWRRHVVYPDITLGCSGKAYGVMDQPLTVSLPGEVASSRCYFIPDGREDPYGKRKFAVGSAGHTKALHLAPLWAAACGGDQALALAFYSDGVLNKPNVTNLQSHFVVRKPDAIYVDGDACVVTREAPLAVPIGALVTLRYGSAAVAASIPWATTRDGSVAPIHLVDDGNPHDVLRLTVEHWGVPKSGPASADNNHPLPGVAICVQIASGLGNDEFSLWRGGLSRVSFKINADAVQMSSTDDKGVVSLGIDNPWESKRKVHVVPEPPDGILLLNGKELGRPILEPLEAIRRFREGETQ
ncbi:MAG: hypothetical protein QGH15_00215 [Kiritimatiellia bacterium]|nr:hypothetical protein [Kiritimatiellia bacterium]